MLACMISHRIVTSLVYHMHNTCMQRTPNTQEKNT